MSTVDKRVVEMDFDNKQFESGIDTSLKTIDKLKKGLDFKDSERSLDRLVAAGKSFSISNIAENVQSIAGRFSALGIIGMSTLANITAAAISAGTQWLHSLTLKPAEMGFQEYETQMGAIQTILANTSSDHTTLSNVTDALQILNTYSDKTIYNFTQMAKNIGTFTAAGVKLNVAVDAIKGIANLAAVSGSNAEQASNAMYQLSQALASGTVKLMDWNSVVNSGMGGEVFKNALMETARVHGIAIDDMVKSEGSFRETLQKGWLTSDILTETLSKFTGDLNSNQLKTMGYSEEQIKSIIELGKMANDAATKVKTFTQLQDTLAEAVQSGWTNTWQIIIGDFNEATDLMTGINGVISQMISKSATARNGLLQGWKDLGGRSMIIDAVTKALETLSKISGVVESAFKSIFPPVTSKQLVILSRALLDLSLRFKTSYATTMQIKSVFKGLFALVDIGRMAIVALAKSLSGLGGPLGKTSANILTLLASGGNWIVNLRNQIKATDAFGKALERFKIFLQTSGQKVKLFVDSVVVQFNKIKPFLTNMIANIKSFVEQIMKSFSGLSTIDTGGITGFIDRLSKRFSPLTKFGNLVWKIFAVAGKAVLIFHNLIMKALPFVFSMLAKSVNGIDGFLDGVSKRIETFDFKAFFDTLNAALLGGLILAIQNFVNTGGGFLDKVVAVLDGKSGVTGKVSEIMGKISGILDGVRSSLEAYQNNLKSDMLLKIAAALGILTLSVVALSLIDSKRLTAALLAMSVMFVQLGVSFAILDKIMASSSVVDSGKLVLGLLGIAAAILIMAGAVAILGKLDAKELGKGLGAVGLLMAMLVISASILSQTSDNMIVASVGLVIFAGALTILVGAVERLSRIDQDKLTRGLIAIGVLMTELVLFMKSTDASGMGVVKSVGILILAGAIEVLAFSVTKLSQIDSDKLTRGLVAVGAILAEVSAFVNSTSNAAQVVTTAIALVILSGAMLILSNVLTQLGKLSWDEIGKGLVSMGGALLIIGIAANLLPKDLIITGASLVVVASALVILAQSLKVMGSMTWAEIGQGLTVLGGALLILAIGLRAMTGTIPGMVALTLASAALALLAPPLKLLGSMDLIQIGAALLALAGVFTVFGIASMLLVETIPVMLALAGVLLLVGVAGLALGVGIGAIGSGILAFSAGMAAFGAAGTAGVTMVLFMITGIAGLIPMLVTTIGTALISLLKVLADGIPLILSVLESFFGGFIIVLGKLAPPLAATIILLIATTLDTIAKNIPSIIESGKTIIFAILKGFEGNTEKFTVIGANILLAFLKGMKTKIPELVKGVYEFVIALINGFSAAIDEHMPELMVAVTNLAFAIIKGLIKGWLDSSAAIRQGMIDVVNIVIKAAKDALGIHSPSTVFTNLGLMTLIGFINGILSQAGKLNSTIINIVNNLILGFTNNVARFTNAGSILLNALVVGIENVRAQLIAKAKSLIDSSISTINGKVTDFKDSGTKLINNLVAGAESIRTSWTNKVRSLADSGISTINSKSGEFKSSGSTLIDNLTSGAESVRTSWITKLQDIATASLTSVNEKFKEFKDSGSKVIDNLIEGVETYKQKIFNNIGSLVESSKQTFDDNIYRFYNVGHDIVENIKEGVGNYIYLAVTAATTLAQAVLEVIQNILGINTPNQDTKDTGQSVVGGLVKGLEVYAPLAVNAAKDLGKKTLAGLSSVLSTISESVDASLNSEPTIKPIIDLSEIEKGGAKINGLLRPRTLSLSSSFSGASNISSQMSETKSRNDIVNPSQPVIKAGDTITFVQNNTSPKALSRLEMYRNTQNQLAKLKKR